MRKIVCKVNQLCGDSQRSYQHFYPKNNEVCRSIFIFNFQAGKALYIIL